MREHPPFTIVPTYRKNNNNKKKMRYKNEKSRVYLEWVFADGASEEFYKDDGLTVLMQNSNLFFSRLEGKELVYWPFFLSPQRLFSLLGL